MKPDDLKEGNPALTDEHVQYGLRRAAEIVAKHAAAGTEAFRKRYPGAVHLAEIQLAAICAEAYREGMQAGHNKLVQSFSAAVKPNPYP